MSSGSSLKFVTLPRASEINNAPGSDVPRTQSVFPKSIETSTRNIRQIERRRTIAPDCLRIHREVREVAREVGTFANVVRKTRTQHRRLNSSTDDTRIFRSLSVAPCPRSAANISSRIGS